MMLDDKLTFSDGQAITATAASTAFYDQLTGDKDTTTFDTAPKATWGVNETYFGEDLGVGAGMGTPRVVVSVGTVFATLTTLQVQFQGAPNNATAQASGLRSDLVFVTYIQTDTIATALLTASTQIASFDWPMRKTGAGLPRFVQLNYVVAGSNATTGTLKSAVTLGPNDGQSTLGQYGSGFSVKG
jgi:hypothetical protein